MLQGKHPRDISEAQHTSYEGNKGTVHEGRASVCTRTAARLVIREDPPANRASGALGSKWANLFYRHCLLAQRSLGKTDASSTRSLRAPHAVTAKERRSPEAEGPRHLHRRRHPAHPPLLQRRSPAARAARASSPVPVHPRCRTHRGSPTASRLAPGPWRPPAAYATRRRSRSKWNGVDGFRGFNRFEAIRGVRNTSKGSIGTKWFWAVPAVSTVSRPSPAYATRRRSRSE